MTGPPNRFDPAEDRELLRRVHEHNDAEARATLIERHLPLVRAIARRYANRGEPLEDIEQVGAIGLIKAIDGYDLTRGVALSTYATPTVLGEIKRHFRDRGWTIRIPRGLQELNGKLGPALDVLGSRLGRSPSLRELAHELDVSPEQVLEAIEAASAYSPLSLSGYEGDEEKDPLEAIGQTDPGYEDFERRATLEPALDSLADRERSILRMRFVDGLTQTEIAASVGISQMHVSRLIRKSLQAMRDDLSPS